VPERRARQEIDDQKTQHQPTKAIQKQAPAIKKRSNLLIS